MRGGLLLQQVEALRLDPDEGTRQPGKRAPSAGARLGLDRIARPLDQGLHMGKDEAPLLLQVADPGIVAGGGLALQPGARCV